MKDIYIEEIKHSQQDYDTIGNYGKNGDRYWITVSKQKGYCETEEELQGVVLHELVEMLLCAKRGIKFKDITDWDIKHEKDEREPGEIKGCCYYNEHKFANKIELLFLDELKKHGKKR